MEQLNPKGCACVTAVEITIRHSIRSNNSKSSPERDGLGDLIQSSCN